MRRRHPTLRRIAIALGGVLALLALCVGALAVAQTVYRNRRVALPAPAGPYHVGRVRLEWTDATRDDPFVAGRAKRTLPVEVWYPTEVASGPAAPYLSPARQRAVEREGGAWIRRRPDRVETHAVLDAPLAASPNPFPVLVFAPGLGPAASDYGAILEDLAGRGYVVVAYTPTGSANVTVLADGRVVRATPRGNPPDDTGSAAVLHARFGPVTRVWVEDMRFVLSRALELNRQPGRFAGRLDTTRVGLFGHSLGGATALAACALDSRCAAAADLDGTLYGDAPRLGIPRPVMVMISGEGPCDSVCAAAQREQAAYVARAPRGSVLVTVAGARHFDFSDLGLVMPVWLGRQLGALGDIAPREALRLTSSALAAFFGEQLAASGAPTVAAALRGFPAARVDAR